VTCAADLEAQPLKKGCHPSFHTSHYAIFEAQNENSEASLTSAVSLSVPFPRGGQSEESSLQLPAFHLTGISTRDQQRPTCKRRQAFTAGMAQFAVVGPCAIFSFRDQGGNDEVSALPLKVDGRLRRLGAFQLLAPL
jgi:hypothetical protein